MAHNLCPIGFERKGGQRDISTLYLIPQGWIAILHKDKEAQNFAINT